VIRFALLGPCFHFGSVLWFIAHHPVAVALL
jgi:hypothetical protein